MQRDGERLSLAEIVAYGLPAIPLVFMTFLVNLYLLKFTTDVLHIAPTHFGSFFAVARTWDALIDPLVGHWSDRTRSRLGRRRSWLLAACVPLGILFAAVWSPPQLADHALELWMGLAILLYYTVHSAASVPHLALGAELTLDYHERSRLATGRGIFELIGMVLAAVAIGHLGGAKAPRAAGQPLAVAFGLTTLVLFALHVAFTREREAFQGRGAPSLVAAGRDVLVNPHARILLLVFFMEMLSLSFLGVLSPFLAQYVGPGLNPGVAIGTVMGMALVSVPLWLRLSRRLGKRTPWLIAIAGKGLGFGLLYFLGSEMSALSVLAMGLIGSGQACTAILPTSIKADVIDYDELETGERKEGAYFAAWTLASQLASALAIAASGFWLAWAGYQPNAAEQAPETIEALLVLSSAVPFGLHVIALLLLSRFQLGPSEHERIRRGIAARSSARQETT